MVKDIHPPASSLFCFVPAHGTENYEMNNHCRRLVHASSIRPGSLLFFLLCLVFFCSRGKIEIVPARPLRIFVADIPAKYNFELLNDGGAAGCNEYVTNLFSNPIGAVKNLSNLDGVRNSIYYGMEIYWHYQIVHSPLRVHHIDDSDLVFVPLYSTGASYDKALGPCSTSYEKSSDTIRHFFQNLRTLLPLLGQKPHWIPLSALELEHMDGCGGWGSEMLCLENANIEKFVFTVPEVATIEVPSSPSRTQFRTAVPRLLNTVPVPYFGHFHVSQVKIPLDDVATLFSKSALASLVIGSRDALHGAPLRPKLRDDCSARNDLCLMEPQANDTIEANDAITDLYKKSWFCLQPYGDTPTRLAFFDCATMGSTLPVVFDEHYKFLLAFSDVIDYSEWLVNIDLEVALSKKNVLEVLDQQVDLKERLKRLRALQRVAHLFQYAAVPSHNLVTFEGMRNVHPADDAFTAALKAVLRNLCRRGQLPRGRCNPSQE